MPVQTKFAKTLSFRHSVNRLWMDQVLKYHYKMRAGIFRQYFVSDAVDIDADAYIFGGQDV